MSGRGPTNTLVKTKKALDGLLSTQSEEKCDVSDGDDEDDDDVDNTQHGDLRSGIQGEEATAADLEKEASIVDAKQLVNKEKARADLEKRTQAKVATAALKKIEDERKQAGKEAAKQAKAQAKASGLSKRKR